MAHPTHGGARWGRRTLKNRVEAQVAVVFTADLVDVSRHGERAPFVGHVCF